MKTKKKENSDWEYFDDCLICQEMKKADQEDRSLSLEELETVFAKQNLRNKLNRR